jgi:hypothetical protein
MGLIHWEVGFDLGAPMAHMTLKKSGELFRINHDGFTAKSRQAQMD